MVSLLWFVGMSRIKRAAIGIRMHSGWGVLVAIAGGLDSTELLDRRRILTTEPKTAGAKQPYHYATSLEPREQEIYLASCAVASERLAAAAIETVVRELEKNAYQVEGAAVLMASGRPLPSVSKILASHALIHTAEGEFFRNAVRNACDTLHIVVTAIRERDLDQHARALLGDAAARVANRISGFASSAGPPWTQDHKAAALAAALILV